MLRVPRAVQGCQCPPATMTLPPNTQGHCGAIPALFPSQALEKQFPNIFFHPGSWPWLFFPHSLLVSKRSSCLWSGFEDSDTSLHLLRLPYLLFLLTAGTLTSAPSIRQRSQSFGIQPTCKWRRRRTKLGSCGTLQHLIEVSLMLFFQRTPEIFLSSPLVWTEP